jgi:hypothetical protein
VLDSAVADACLRRMDVEQAFELNIDAWNAQAVPASGTSRNPVQELRSTAHVCLMSLVSQLRWHLHASLGLGALAEPVVASLLTGPLLRFVSRMNSSIRWRS